MDPRTRARSRRRLALPLLLAIALAGEASGAALAVPRHGQPGGGLDIGPGAFAGARVSGGPAGGARSAEPIADWARRPDTTTERIAESRQAATQATPAAVAVAEPIGRSGTTASSGYRGTNHVWIPSLGINRSIAFFPCSRTKPPGHQVYRWGCAGSNNVYLLAHAATVFKPLHDAYVRGRLRRGMEVVYADGDGRITRYAVSYWKVVAPDGDVGWAFAGQSSPSMTLQTCVGSNSEYRLVVRLVKKD
jgi:hypothetical protein